MFKNHLPATVYAAVLFILFGAPVLPANASGGPFAVDDAEIVRPGSCAVQAWTAYSRARDRETVIAPACHLVPDVEFTGVLAFGRDSGSAFSQLGIEAKSTLTETGPGLVGIGFVGGAVADLGGDGLALLSSYVPISLDLRPDLRLNVNGGWEWDRVAREHAVTWGAGVDWGASPSLNLIAGLFGQSGTHPAYQVGIRPWLIPDRLHLDIVYGRNLIRPGSDTASIGLVAAF